MATMPNCEDEDYQPCMTYDESVIKRVDSYKPYTAKNVRECGTQKHYPCATYNKKNGTFSYYWKGDF